MKPGLLKQLTKFRETLRDTSLLQRVTDVFIILIVYIMGYGMRVRYIYTVENDQLRLLSIFMSLNFF